MSHEIRDPRHGSADETRHRAALRVPPTHPALPGHFPGRPVVPGVVILDQVIDAAERCSGHPLQVTALPVAKFLSPLLPGVAAAVQFSRHGKAWSFVVTSGDVTIARGVLHAVPAGAP
jgi:3-hydroxymyristoyl/3-hydroxydecanoyl-(acyl carrier protein) dehydratase